MALAERCNMLPRYMAIRAKFIAAERALRLQAPQTERIKRLQSQANSIINELHELPQQCNEKLIIPMTDEPHTILGQGDSEIRLHD